MSKVRNCVTHHYACDCREDKFKKIETQNDKLMEFVKDCSVSHVETRYKYRAQVIISEIKQGGDK